MVFQGTFTNSNGSVLINNGATVQLPAALNLGSGVFAGSGTLIAPGGVISGGLVSPDNLAVTGDFTLQPSATLAIMLRGATTPGTDYSLLAVSGTATFNGNLMVQFGNGFESSVLATDTFTVLTSGSTLSGSFSNVTSGSRLITSDGLGSFIVDYGSGSPYGVSNLVLIDFQPIPEPATWLLLTLGTGVAGFSIRRRRKNLN